MLDLPQLPPPTLLLPTPALVSAALVLVEAVLELVTQTVSVAWTGMVNVVLPVAPQTPATVQVVAAAAVPQASAWVFPVAQLESAVAALNVAAQSHVSGMSTQTIGYVTIPDGIVPEVDLQITGPLVLVHVGMVRKQTIVEPRNRVA